VYHVCGRYRQRPPSYVTERHTALARQSINRKPKY
jgi:hypothetical protein